MTRGRSIRRVQRLALRAMLCCIAPGLGAQPLTFLVGADAACDHATIQAAIDAAATHPGEDFIRIAGNQPYTAQALAIGRQDLTLTGGYADCVSALPADASPTGSTTLDGAGGAAAPVVSISDSGVRVLRNLQIRNGDNLQSDSSGCGGGVRFRGSGELRTENLAITQNDADSGGGICFVATGATAALTLGSETVISNNQALVGNGGGIAVAGPARFFALRDRILIAFNVAAEDGGGVFVQVPARSDIGSPGYNGLGVLFSNEANRGGGLAGYARDGDDTDGCMRFFTTDAQRPVRIQANRARSAGGGIYLRSSATSPTDGGTVHARAYDFRIDGNTAPNGPAAFLDGEEFFIDDNGSTLVLNADTLLDACNEPLFELGRVGCSNTTECNRIEDNRAQDINGTPTAGNVIELQDDSEVRGGIVTMTRNVGTRLFAWGGGNFGAVRLDRCALVGNELTQELIRGFDPGVVVLEDCVIAGNAIGAGSVFRFEDSEGSARLGFTLVDQPGRIVHTPAAPKDTFVRHEWVLATETDSLQDHPTVQLLQGSGRYVDPERGDYRLAIGSRALDYAPPRPAPPFGHLGGSDIDLDGRSRNIDFFDTSADTRARDLGPYERQYADPWLRNGHFAGDLRLWTVETPAFTSFAGDFNAPGSVGGSVVLNVPLDQATPNDRRTALSQCFNVPSGGRYFVSGRALVGAGMNNRDYPIVAWRTRYGSGDCSGPVDDSGDLFFGRSGSTWQPVGVNNSIDVDPARWTWFTTIELRLDVAQDPASTSLTSLFARFDAIEIGKLGDFMFRDGFE